MGYGEFGGTNSVEWKVVHGDKGQKGKDKDPQPPKGGDGEFTVVVNGMVVARVPIDYTNPRQIKVIWSPDTLASIP